MDTAEYWPHHAIPVPSSVLSYETVLVKAAAPAGIDMSKNLFPENRTCTCVPAIGSVALHVTNTSLFPFAAMEALKSYDVELFEKSPLCTSMAALVSMA